MDRNNRKYELRISDSIHLETSVCNNRSKVFLTFILVVAIVIFLLPLIVLILLIIPEEEGIPFGFLLTCIISCFVSFYLLRLYLWNKYGKEVFIIKDGIFVYYYDYKLFRDHYKEIDFKELNVYYIFNGSYRNILDIWEASITDQKMKKLLSSESTVTFEIDNNPDIISSLREIPISAIMDIGRTLSVKGYYSNINGQKSNI